MRLLEQLAEALGKEGPPIRLCLIGSAACLFGGMDGRTSRDLDIWKPASNYDRMELKRAVESIGLLFDPKTTLEPEKPYLQLIEPGVIQVGTFEPILMDRLGRLEIWRPPIENLIVSKLVRFDAKDLSDIRFLISRHRPDGQVIRKLIQSLPPTSREHVLENLVYLDILSL